MVLLILAAVLPYTALAAGTWIPTASFTTARQGHTATLLPNGKVLLAGGYSIQSSSYLNNVYLYDPATGTWSAAASCHRPVLITRPLCCPTAKSWWPGAITATAM